MDEEDKVRDVARVAYADMLLDDERNRKYEEAITKAVNKIESKGRGVRVVDVGTGTGLLSMMAARISKNVQVTAFEAELEVALTAREIIKRNGLSDQITVVHKRGEYVTLNDLKWNSNDCEKSGDDGRADLLITELFDTELIGEGALIVYQAVLDRIMRKDCLAVPSKAKIMCKPVGSTLLFGHHGFICYEEYRDHLKIPQSVLSCPGSSTFYDVQMNQLNYRHDIHDFQVEPQVAFEFDFTKQKTLSSKEKIISWTPCRHPGLGRDGISYVCLLVWWDLVMDDEEEVVLSVAPLFADNSHAWRTSWEFEDMCDRDATSNWREHWIQSIYFPFPDCISDETIHIRAKHDSFSLFFEYMSNGNPHFQSSGCSCGHHIHVSRPRMSLLNSRHFWDSLMDHLLQQDLDDTTKLVYLGHSSYLPIMAAKKSPSIPVYCKLTSKSCQGFIQDFAAANKLTNILEMDSFPMPLDGTFVLLEPFLSTSDTPLQSLVLWSQIPRGIPDSNILINRVQVKLLVVQFNHLWKTCVSVKSVCGFDITPFDQMIQSSIKKVDPSVESYYLWEYPSRSLIQEPQVAFDISFKEYVPDETLNNSLKLLLTRDDMKPELKHIAVCWWSDFFDGDKLVWSTGPDKEVIQGSYISWKRQCRQTVSWCFFPDDLRTFKSPFIELDMKTSLSLSDMKHKANINIL